MILFLTVEYIIYLPYQTFFLEKHHYFLQYSNLQHIVSGNAAICSKFFIFEPGNPSGWKEHVKMYQNPKFHIVCQIWSLYMKNVINPVYHSQNMLVDHLFHCRISPWPKNSRKTRFLQYCFFLLTVIATRSVCRAFE